MSLPSTLAPLAGCLLAFAAAAQQVPEVRFTVQRFQVEGPNPIGDAAAQAVLAPFRGEYSGLDGVLAAVDALESAIADQGYGFHRAVLPPQELKDGLLRVEVVVFTLGLVGVEGNEHFSTQSVLRSLPSLVPGEAPDAAALGRDVAVANRHPSKKLAITMKRGSTPGEVDATVRVEDSRPVRVFAGLNNTGDERTGNTRASIGAQHSNVFGLDHVLTGSYTTSPGHLRDVKQIGFNYQIPVYPWHGWLSLGYVHSDVNSGIVADFFDVSGSGNFFRAAFRQSLPRIGSYRHAWSVVVQDRLFRNDSALVGGPAIGTDVRSRPLGLRYEGSVRLAAGTAFEFGIEGVHNLPGGGHNNDGAYRSIRSGADASWNALRFDAGITQPVGRGWLARFKLSGQYAGEPLIPGEQLGVGGSTTVRGFEERASSGDNGVIVNAEVWTPPIFGDGGPRLLGFVDAGHRTLENAQAGEQRADTLASAGVGARWQWKESLGMALDWARVFEQAQRSSIDAGNVKLHFRLFVRY